MADPENRLSAPGAVASPVLQVDDLQVAYGRGSRAMLAVKGVGLSVHPGEVVALVGESGSGKSTTAHAILGLLRGDARIAAGRIRIDGDDMAGASDAVLARVRGLVVGYVPQDPGVALNPVQRIGAQVAEVLRIHRKVSPRGVEADVFDILRDMGLSDPELQARKYPHELSGGMRQRVLIGIALACRPKLVVADEPTSALDVTVQRRILDHLISMTRRLGTGVLLITHDLAVAADRADRIVVMRNGLVVETGDVGDILAAPSHEYTRALIAAAPGFAKSRSGGRAAATRQAEPPRLELIGLQKTFVTRSGETVSAVRDVSLSIVRGTSYGLVGESGSGKTTTARIAACFETASRGRILLDGEDVGALRGEALRQFRRKVQFIHQNPYSSLDPRFSVADILIEPLKAFGIGSTRERRARAEELVEQVALEPVHLDRRPSQLSGGQRQRVAIARALALSPEVIILDEPVSALDVLVQDQILRLLTRLQQELGLTYLFISHDLGVVRQVSHRVGVMQSGRLVETGETEAVFATPSHAYTRELFDAVPGRHGRQRTAPAAL